IGGEGRPGPLDVGALHGVLAKPSGRPHRAVERSAAQRNDRLRGWARHFSVFSAMTLNREDRIRLIGPLALYFHKLLHFSAGLSYRCDRRISASLRSRRSVLRREFPPLPLLVRFPRGGLPWAVRNFAAAAAYKWKVAA